jgi:hypothetical protein
MTSHPLLVLVLISFVNLIFVPKLPPNHYTLLNVSPLIPSKQLKRAFRQAALKHHPDKPGGNEERFQELNHAYETLRDNRRRDKYNRFGPHASEEEVAQDFASFYGPCLSLVFLLTRLRQYKRILSISLCTLFLLGCVDATAKLNKTPRISLLNTRFLLFEEMLVLRSLTPFIFNLICLIGGGETVSEEVQLLRMILFKLHHLELEHASKKQL